MTRLLRAREDLPALLEAVARTIGESLGYRTVAVNLYQPEWDNFEVTTVYGNEDARATLHSDFPIDGCARADVPLGGPDHALPQKQSHTKPAKDQAPEDNALNYSKWSAPSRAAQGPNGPRGL